MLFTIACYDKPDHLALRMATRPTHVTYVGQFAADLLVAGAMLDDQGQPCGSLLVIDCADRAAAEAFAAGDPYAKAGLFGQTMIRAYRVAYKDGAPV